MSETDLPRHGDEIKGSEHDPDPAQQMLDAIQAIVETLDTSPPDAREAIGEARRKLQEDPLPANPDSALALPPQGVEKLTQLRSLILQFMTLAEARFDVLEKQGTVLQEQKEAERDKREAAERRATKLFTWGIVLGLPIGIFGSFIAWLIGIN